MLDGSPRYLPDPIISETPKEEDISCLTFVGVLELKKLLDLWRLIIWPDACL